MHALKYPGNYSINKKYYFYRRCQDLLHAIVICVYLFQWLYLCSYNQINPNLRPYKIDKQLI